MVKENHTVMPIRLDDDEDDDFNLLTVISLFLV